MLLNPLNLGFAVGFDFLAVVTVRYEAHFVRANFPVAARSVAYVLWFAPSAVQAVPKWWCFAGTVSAFVPKSFSAQPAFSLPVATHSVVAWTAESGVEIAHWLTSNHALKWLTLNAPA